MDARSRKVLCLLTLGGHWMATTAQADGLLDRFKAGKHKQLKQEYHTKEVTNGPPWDLTQVASMVDIVEEGILDDGTVVIKRPDVWSQARMTKYRREFEVQMADQLNKFDAVLSARIARTDQASFESATTLGAALQGSGGGGQKPAAIVAAPPASNQAELIKAQADATQAQANADTAAAQLTTAQTAQAVSLAKQNLSQLEPTKGGSNDFSQTAPFGLLGEKGAFQNYAKNVGMGNLGLEPTIYLDEQKRYLDHLNELRRVNLGDDNADSAGYSLSLVRLPVSIQPGAKTEKGHGALLNVTARPEFRPDFLPTTFRSLVVQDIIDQLTPVLYEILDRHLDDNYSENLVKWRNDVNQRTTELADLKKKLKTALEAQSITKEPSSPPLRDEIDPKAALGILRNTEANRVKSLATEIERLQNESPEFRSLTAEIERLQKESLEFQSLAKYDSVFRKILSPRIPSTRLAARPYPISPTDLDQVMMRVNLMHLALAVRQSITTVNPRASEIRAFLYQISESAYQLFPRFEPMIGEIALTVNNHQHNEIPNLYDRLQGTLPGVMAKPTNYLEELRDPVTIMCWAIAVDAGQLDERLKEEMKRLDGQSGFHPACDLDSLLFYLSEPQPEAREVFQSYVNARWPIICFALDPVTDQQNIADAVSIRRDLQIAMSFAFATGKINFNQFNRFRRRIELDAETIALNRTVTTFAHGNESFGWRFYPRFQNPPQEATNFNVIGNQLLRGGPGRDYQVKNSKLEAGQRELTAVIILPSILPRVRFEVIGNWFKLTQPDDLTVSTARMVWQGRQVMKLRDAVTKYCDPRLNRPGDLERVLTKVDRVEQMLPMQTESVAIPYQNTQGGFDLFTPGLSSLVPELLGYDGIDKAESGKDASFLVFGKNLSIHETKVVAGGQTIETTAIEILSREVMRVTVPASLLGTEMADRPDRPYLEVVAATPNGISNRLAIPIKPVKPPEKVAGSGYNWKAAPSYVAYARYNESGVIDPKGPTSYFKFEAPPTAEIILNANKTFPNDPGYETSPLIPGSITHMALRLKFQDKAGKDVVINAKTTKPAASFVKVGEEVRATISFKENLEEPIIKALTEVPRGLKLSAYSAIIDVTAEAYILVEGSSTAIKLDDPIKLTVNTRDSVPVVPVEILDSESIIPPPSSGNSPFFRNK